MLVILFLAPLVLVCGYFFMLLVFGALGLIFGAVFPSDEPTERRGGR